MRASTVATPDGPDQGWSVRRAVSAVTSALTNVPGLTSVGLWALGPDRELRLLSLHPPAAGLDAPAPSRPGWPSAPDARSATVTVPIRANGRVLGMIAADTEPGRAGDAGRELLTALAPLAAALLEEPLRATRLRGELDDRIQSVIAERAFGPVFQPIVELAGGSVVGYEALTRFDDGTPPDLMFSRASEIRHGIALEAATLAAVLDAGRSLPPETWLNLNVSPEFVLSGEPLRKALEGWDRTIVLELTEHTPIESYGALRRTIKSLRPRVQLAVDDAGAGFASFRHILELRPAFVKLDRGILHSIDRDPMRQAFVASMTDFARAADIVLIGEGVETEAEVDALRRLGVPLAQGYRLGRPASVPFAPVAARQGAAADNATL